MLWFFGFCFLQAVLLMCSALFPLQFLTGILTLRYLINQIFFSALCIILMDMNQPSNLCLQFNFEDVTSDHRMNIYICNSTRHMKLVKFHWICQGFLDDYGTYIAVAFNSVLCE